MKKYMFLLSALLILLAACQGKGGLNGTKWNLMELQGEPLLTGTSATLEFTQDGVAGGFAGCNSFGAQTTEIKGKTIQLEELVQTEMACLENDSSGTNTGLMDQESRYMQTLSKVRTFKLEGESLTLFGESGEELLVYQAAK